MPLVYLGLGRSDRLTCEALRGMNVLESFAYRRDYFERYRPTWACAFLDSGAFTEMTQGVAIDLGEYIAFAQEHGRFYAAIANLDDIRGDVDRSRANHLRMLDAGVKAMPVFHQGEPWSVLDEVCAAAPERYIGLRAARFGKELARRRRQLHPRSERRCSTSRGAQLAAAARTATHGTNCRSRCAPLPPPSSEISS